MIAIVKRRATYQDIVDLPENLIGEILDGELHVSPRPASLHASASSALGMLLAPLRFGGGGPGRWLILDEPELHLGPDPDVLVPDLAGWRRERMPEMPVTPAFTLSPDWVCEVLSPSTAKLDRTRKLAIYAREKVGHIWLIDPELRTLEVLVSTEGAWSLIGTHADEAKVRVPPFEALELDLAKLFSR